MDVAQILKNYERDGVVRVPQFLPPPDVKQIRQEIENYVGDIASKLEPSEVTFEADGGTARNLWRPHLDPRCGFLMVSGRTYPD